VAPVALYFAYGSNMASARLQERAPSARPLGPALLPGYAWRCNKRGADGTAKANLVAMPGAETWGVLYEVHARDWDAIDRAEGGYERIPVEVLRDGVRGPAQTYISDRIAEDWSPARWYLGLVAAGAREHALPDAWLAAITALMPAESEPAGERIAFEDPSNHCFGCSPHNGRGLQLAFTKVDRGVVEARYVAAPDLCGMDGVVHGGVQAAILDEAMGFAAHAAFDDPDESDVATIELSLKYRRPTPTGQALLVRARFVRADARDVWLSGEIRDAEGRLCTEAESRWRRLRT
jgi:gamma-glutamylcyclotransferase